MQMKINEKVLSIPPYISTTWTHISALRMKANLLSVTLTDGETISISGLSQDQINLIFSFHAAHLEKEILPTAQANHAMPNSVMLKEGFGPFGDPATLSFALGSMDGFNTFALGSADGFNTLIQHNQSQANSPDLPSEVLHKISQIARVIMPLDDAQLPKAEPHCNCFHCQIARALDPNLQADPINVREVEEDVRDDELQFEQWSISSAGDKLYNVVNRLDEQEKYKVYLGHPVGCTCGREGCEHILAVLKS